MNAKKLLLVFEDKGRGISDILVNRGFRAIVSDDIFKALEKIENLSFAAVVVVFRHNKHIEAMDFVFNIREAKTGLPIIIIDDSGESYLNPEVLQTKSIFILREEDRRLADKVADIIAEYRSED
jgi:DNA-binding NtrC family response regulator